LIVLVEQGVFLKKIFFIYEYQKYFIIIGILINKWGMGPIYRFCVTKA